MLLQEIRPIYCIYYSVQDYDYLQQFFSQMLQGNSIVKKKM